MNAPEATSAAQLLHAFRQLVENQAWKEIVAPKIKEALERHTSGISDRGKTAADRAEHVEAFHLAADLSKLVPEKIATLERQLGDWMKSQDVVDSRIADVLGA